MIKRCSKCKIQKDGAEFNKDRNGTLGLQAVCRSCTSLYSQAYKEKRKKEGPVRYVDYKVCARCHMERPRSQFGKRTLSPDGLGYYCKPCQKVLTNNSRRAKLK